MLEEKRKWDGGLLNQSISPIVKTKTKEVPTVAPSSTSSSSTTALSEQQSAPPPSPWKNFQPQSPSPLSPSSHKTRSPRPHLAGKRSKPPKTPLARLVLEKAVRQREKESASGGVFGAESSKANIVPAEKTKVEKADRKVDLKASTRIGQSIGPGAKRESGVKAGWR